MGQGDAVHDEESARGTAEASVCDRFDMLIGKIQAPNFECEGVQRGVRPHVAYPVGS